MLQLAGQAAPAPLTQAVSAQLGLIPRISQLTGKIKTKKLKICPHAHKESSVPAADTGAGAPC